jgi:hypothetical protein
MHHLELRDGREARRYLLQGLWLQRTVSPATDTVRPALEWAREIVAAGQPLPPLGFVADLGHLLLGTEWDLSGATRTSRDLPVVPGLPVGLARTYEDHVLGKMVADWTLARAGDALRRYQGRDRARGLAFVVTQFLHRAGFQGVELSPGIVKSLLEVSPREVLAQGWEALERDGLQPVLAELMQSLVMAVRRSAEALDGKDLFELEHGSALAEEGERLALRQVLQAAESFEAGLPRQRPRARAVRKVVPTRVLDEDAYPVGGFSSLSNRGSVESLLHSQLAFMEKAERPDLFDIKFLRDELLYYARDENEFLRRRRTFVFALYADLIESRFKDPALPYQRGVLLLALLVVLVRQLSDWLSTDALVFVFQFPVNQDEDPLAPERALIEALLREGIANGSVVVEKLPDLAAMQSACTRFTRRSLCHCLSVSVAGQPFQAENAVVSELRLDGPRPTLVVDPPWCSDEASDPLQAWHEALFAVLALWSDEL